ncbi:TniQ family protein [Rhizobium beringeri]
MTAIDGQAPVISIRERYRDIVSERWPIITTPQPDELLSSWLHRLAYSNGVPARAFARVLGLNSGMWSAALDLRLPIDVANQLQTYAGVSLHQLTTMTLSHSARSTLATASQQPAAGSFDLASVLLAMPRRRRTSRIFGGDGGWQPVLHATRMAADCVTDALPAAATLPPLTRASSCRNIIVPCVVTTCAAHRPSTYARWRED